MSRGSDEAAQNIDFKYCGVVEHAGVHETLLGQEVLLLPSYGENFGHAILEALLAGCPVIISDQTPWKGLEASGVGADLPIEDIGRFEAALQKFMDMDDDEYQRWSKRAKEFGLQRA